MKELKRKTENKKGQIDNNFKIILRMNCSLPNKGIASDTCGKVSATKLRNTVSDRRIVTPIKNSSVGILVHHSSACFVVHTLKMTMTVFSHAKRKTFASPERITSPDIFVLETQ